MSNEWKQTVDDGYFAISSTRASQWMHASSSSQFSLLFSHEAFDRDVQQEKQLLNAERGKTENTTNKVVEEQDRTVSVMTT